MADTADLRIIEDTRKAESLRGWAVNSVCALRSTWRNSLGIRVGGFKIRGPAGRSGTARWSDQGVITRASTQTQLPPDTAFFVPVASITSV